MAYAAIAGIIPQYDQSSYWLKFYEPGTTNPIAMATDITATTTLAKAQLDVDGFPTTDGSTLFIPFIDQPYDAYLFPTSAEADDNDTINAIRVADNIVIITPISGLPVADLVENYGAKGDAIYQYEVDGSVTVTSGTDDTQALLDAMVDFASGAIGALTVPDGNFWIDSSQIDTPTGTTIIGAGSEATKFIMSTTTPNLNLFVGFYQSARVSNISFSGVGFVGSKFDDNTVGGTCIFTLGATNVYGNDLACEGSKGLAWFGEDTSDLFGTQNVFFNNLRVTDCKLFSVYMRGVEVPAVGFDKKDETSNININGLTIRGSNVGFVCAEGRPYNAKVINYDCQFTDNLLQIEASDDIKISNFNLANATSVWNALSPAPFKEQWQISGSSDVSFVNGHIDAQLQGFAFGTSDVGNDNVSFTNITTGDFFRCTTLNVQDDADQFKGLFSNWNWTNCSFIRPASTFFQSDVGDQSSPEIAYWRDWGFSNCSWSNNSNNNPIVTVAVMGSLVFDDKCTFAGKPPRALKATNITFNATVRANGITGSDMQFTAIDGLDALEPKTLRLGGNFQIEGEVKDVGFDNVHTNADIDSRNTSPQCHTSDAVNFNDSGANFTGFTGDNPILNNGVVTYKSLSITPLPTISGGSTFITEYMGDGLTQDIVTGADSVSNESVVIIKDSGSSASWQWFDSVRGVELAIESDNSTTEGSKSGSLTSFNNDGFSIGVDAEVNTSGRSYISYQLEKSFGFLDIITDTGDGVTKTIPHNLGVDVGCVISKGRDVAAEWPVQYHTLNTVSGDYLVLNESNGIANNTNVWGGASATDTDFTVGTSALTNGSGYEYVHYLFAKNICHSFSGNGTTNNEIIINYKSKLVIIKRATAATTGEFNLFDGVRDASPDFSTKLAIDSPFAEGTIANAITITDTGIIINTADSELNAAGSSYILIAIPEV